ncbi:hypothetical protein [Massilia genomosp. 1]|uniref:Uncharacterized protein n=1 Tax=Massilia genomosp. 1 TaxID=2609280 RepID=A0ABX0N5D4_9BURK|nr:hypothetical protein [Massilia genomosp. 1]NHZ65304.1 hypothetical protein [Massilia genomosp. 1]
MSTNDPSPAVAPARAPAPRPADGMLGMVTVLCIAAVVLYWTGPHGVARVLCTWVLARFVSWLWHRDVGGGKMICVVAVPPVLLVYCLPKSLRRAVNALPSETG